MKIWKSATRLNYDGDKTIGPTLRSKAEQGLNETELRTRGVYQSRKDMRTPISKSRKELNDERVEKVEEINVDFVKISKELIRW